MKNSEITLGPSENCPGLQLDGSVTSDTAAVWTLSVLCFSCMTWLCSEVFYEFSGERLATTNLMNKTTGLGLSEDLIVSVVELCTTVLFLIIYIYVSFNAACSGKPAWPLKGFKPVQESYGYFVVSLDILGQSFKFKEPLIMVSLDSLLQVLIQTMAGTCLALLWSEYVWIWTWALEALEALEHRFSRKWTKYAMQPQKHECCMCVP